MSSLVDASTAQDIFLFLKGFSSPLIVVLGPSASGKTDFSLNVAEAIVSKHRRAEIVNADSRQLYRFLDIGTGKITPHEMRGIPHHLLDILDPKEEATAAMYQSRTTSTIDAILKEGSVPILVGGSMLYLSSIIDALSFPEASNPKIRTELNAAYDKDGGASLYARLQNLDPDAAAAIHPRNKPYVVRAVELLGSRNTLAETKRREQPRFDLYILGMQWSREKLRGRIQRRTDQLFASGWIEEVRALLEKGYGVEDPGMKSLGYREIAAAISSEQWEVNSKKNEQELAKEIATKTMQYAKRQMTWWKRDERIRWITQPSAPRSV